MQKAVHMLTLSKQGFSEFVQLCRLSPSIRDVAVSVKHRVCMCACVRNPQYYSDRGSFACDLLAGPQLGWTFVQQSATRGGATFRMNWKSFCEALFSLANATYTASASDSQRPLRLLIVQHIVPLCAELGAYTSIISSCVFYATRNAAMV